MAYLQGMGLTSLNRARTSGRHSVCMVSAFSVLPEK